MGAARRSPRGAGALPGAGGVAGALEPRARGGVVRGERRGAGVRSGGKSFAAFATAPIRYGLVWRSSPSRAHIPTHGGHRPTPRLPIARPSSARSSVAPPRALRARRDCPRTASAMFSRDGLPRWGVRTPSAGRSASPSCSGRGRGRVTTRRRLRVGRRCGASRCGTCTLRRSSPGSSICGSGPRRRSARGSRLRCRRSLT